MKLIVFPIIGLLSALTVALDAADAPKQKPNIIFVLFDDIGYGQPKCYREGTEFKTPNIDRLAQEGMRFTDAHSAASVCTPTRYGVLTGRYPSRIGQYGVLTTYLAADHSQDAAHGRFVDEAKRLRHRVHRQVAPRHGLGRQAGK